MKAIAAILLISLAGCTPPALQATATEAELCRAWGESLPTRSRLDTAQTRMEIQIGYADFINACPGLEHLVPLMPQ